VHEDEVVGLVALEEAEVDLARTDFLLAGDADELVVLSFAEVGVRWFGAEHRDYSTARE
jgi:hypothetical protein